MTNDKKLKSIIEAVGANWRGNAVIDENPKGIFVTTDFIRSKLNERAFKVYLVLRTYANERRDHDKDGLDVWPSQQTIARDAGLSIATVKRAIADLTEIGLIETRRAGIAERDKAQNIYVLKKGPFSTARITGEASARIKTDYEEKI